MEIHSDGVELGYFEDSVGFFRTFTGGDPPTKIPIAEEWLEKFGLVVKRTYSENKDGLVCRGDDKFDFDSNQTCLVFKVGLKYKIEYVHQLQNLYFALTGEELTIK
jgi:hypothetical protein